MGNSSPLDPSRAAEFLTRLGVAGAALGIDPTPLATAANGLAESIARSARAWLDADFRRIGFRTSSQRPPGLSRPGETYLEVETNPPQAQLVATLSIVGPSSLEDDLRVLAADRTAEHVLAELARKLRMLGSETTAAFGQRTTPEGLQWLVGIGVGAASVPAVCTLADAIGVTSFQQVVLGQLHTELAAHDCTVTLACSAYAMRSELTVEYRDVPWDRVIATTDLLRPTKSARSWGSFSGAFDADRASALQITFNAEQLARVRVAIDFVSERS